MKTCIRIFLFMTYTYSFQRYDFFHKTHFDEDYLYFIDLNIKNYGDLINMLKNEINTLNGKTIIDRLEFVEKLHFIIKKIDFEKRKKIIEEDINKFLVKHLSLYPIDYCSEFKFCSLMKEYYRPISLLTDNYKYYSFNSNLTVDQMRVKLSEIVSNLDSFNVDFYIFFSKIKYLHDNKNEYIKENKPLEAVDYLYGSFHTSRRKIYEDIHKILNTDIKNFFPNYFTYIFIRYNSYCLAFEYFKLKIKKEALVFFNKIENIWIFVDVNNGDYERNIEIQKNDIFQFLQKINIIQYFSDINSDINFIYERFESYYDSKTVFDLTVLNDSFQSRLPNMQFDLSKKLFEIHDEIIKRSNNENYCAVKNLNIIQMKNVLDVFMYSYFEISTTFEENFYRILLSVKISEPINILKPKLDVVNATNKIPLKDDINKYIFAFLYQIELYLLYFYESSLLLKEFVSNSTMDNFELVEKNKKLYDLNYKKYILLIPCELELLYQFNLGTDDIKIKVQELHKFYSIMFDTNFKRDLESNLNAINDINTSDMMKISYSNFNYLIEKVKKFKEWLERNSVNTNSSISQNP